MSQPVLRRELGRWDLTAIGVNQVIGSAIFLLPADVARQIGPWGPAAFLGIGLASLLIALCFAEVGSRFDRTGGPYLPARAAYGRFIGFEVGWMMWFTRVASQASVSNGLALAMAFYWPSVASGIPRAALITTVTVILAFINIRGIKQSKWVVNTLTVGKLTPLFLFILVGVWFIDPARFAAMPAVSTEQAGTAALLLIFAYGGYEVTGIPAGEAANPKRDVPFAFVMTIITVTLVMTLTSVVATGILPDLGASRTPLADGAGLIMGAVGALIVSAGAAISMTGNNMGQVLTGSRTIFALAENRDLPRWFAHLHPTHQTPSNAILFTAAVALTLALTGSFVTLAAVSAVARLFMYLAVCTATLVLRRRAPDEVMGPAQFTVPLGPVVPVLASLVAMSILLGATQQQLLMGAYALIAGGILFFIATRERSPA
ncbi:MAG TPA: APC family permease [Vicinamibacterales bacterium]|nr:APC family permease [Vicinamibacterales bacterium]